MKYSTYCEANRVRLDLSNFALNCYCRNEQKDSTAFFQNFIGFDCLSFLGLAVESANRPIAGRIILRITTAWLTLLRASPKWSQNNPT